MTKRPSKICRRHEMHQSQDWNGGIVFTVTATAHLERDSKGVSNSC